MSGRTSPCDHRVDLDSIQVTSDGIELTVTIQCRKCAEWGTAIVDTRDAEWKDATESAKQQTAGANSENLSEEIDRLMREGS